ncbi:MAG: 50S ribosomal protein L24 [Gemmatimonadales bacterium]
MHITKGDTVEIISGNDKGKRGRVIRAYPETGRITIEGVNIRKKHQKPKQSGDGSVSEGGIIELPLPIDHSNVMLIDPKSGEPTRIRKQRDKDGTVERIAVKSGQSIPRTR